MNAFADDRPLPAGVAATLACLLEVSAPKVGNVHRGADFDDVTFVDFALSAAAVGPAMQHAADTGRVGESVLQAVQAMRGVAPNNTYLGAILLLAPLAAVPASVDIGAGVGQVLTQLNAADARHVYEAIRLANPGGLGQVAEADVHDQPPVSLIDAMRLAAERDLVARQYANGFREVLEGIVPRLTAAVVERGRSLADAIVHVQLQTMSDFPDSLIARKSGAAVARQASDWAAQILASGEPGDRAYREGLADLDFWLRADGHKRNPGTTADLIAAGLFVALRDGAFDVRGKKGGA